MDWDSQNLIQGVAYARNPVNGRQYLVFGQAESGGVGEVENSIWHLHELYRVGGEWTLKLVSSMTGLRLGHPQNFHARISVRGNLWIWATVEQYSNTGQRIGARVARLPYLPDGRISAKHPEFAYIEGLKGNSLCAVTSPYTEGPGKITIRRAQVLTETYTEYLETDLTAGTPKPIRSFTRFRGTGTYQSAAASAKEVAVIKGATTQRHWLYRYDWKGKQLSKENVTDVKAPSGPNTSSEPELLVYIDGQLVYGKRYNSTTRRVVALFSRKVGG